MDCDGWQWHTEQLASLNHSLFAEFKVFPRYRALSTWSTDSQWCGKCVPFYPCWKVGPEAVSVHMEKNESTHLAPDSSPCLITLSKGNQVLSFHTASALPHYTHQASFACLLELVAGTLLCRTMCTSLERLRWEHGVLYPRTEVWFNGRFILPGPHR